jgi:hypothetical protein
VSLGGSFSRQRKSGSSQLAHAIWSEALPHPIGPAKNKVRKSGKFSVLKQAPSSHHDSPHNHHKSTSKLPSKKTRFFRTSLKNTSKTGKTRPRVPQNFFVKFEPKKPSPPKSKIKAT